MKKRILIIAVLLLVIVIAILIVIKNRAGKTDYNEFVTSNPIHDVIQTIEDVNVSLVDIESIPEDILEICKEQCREYCLKNGIINETFMYYDSNDTEYVFKSTTTDVVITVYIGGKINE